MEDKEEKCGVFGVFGEGLDASRLTFFGLFALQHRGQENSGIVSTDGETLYAHKRKGLVAQVYKEKHIKSLLGHSAIGHNRYSTSGGVDRQCEQPLVVSDNQIALAHNGNLPSLDSLDEFFKDRNIVVSKRMDSKMMVEAIGVLFDEGVEIESAVERIFPLMTGAFSLLILTKDKLIALRDACGVRPLSVAKLKDGYVFSSETCAFKPMGAEYLDDVKPGEMIVVDAHGMKRKQIVKSTPKLDIFEFIYFSRADSDLLGHSVYDVRRDFGIELAKEYPLNADVVIPVPETAIPVAIGYADKSGIPFEMGIIKNRYIHRTFIEPNQHLREQGVKIKLAALERVIAGKRVIIIDDSIVRGTTSKQIIKMIFDAGAKEVHFLVSSPPVKFPDFYGIDTPRQDDLFAATRSIEEMNKELGSTSLNFLSYEGMIRATGMDEDQFCTSCFTGSYPIDIKERLKEIKYHR